MPILKRLCLLMCCLPFVSVAYAQQPDNLLAIGDFIPAELPAGGTHQWQFEGQAGRIITLSAERFPSDPSNPVDVAFDLALPTGDIIISDDNSGPGNDALFANFLLPMDGMYEVTIRNQNTLGGGTYLLTIADNHLPPGCQTPRGSMVVTELNSDIIGGTVPYRVFLPPCHETTAQRYPYVILMHGSASRDTHWDYLGIDEALIRGMALNRLPPMAIVMPFGGGRANVNNFQPGYSWEYVLIDEFVPHIEQTHCLIQNDRYYRAIGGISRGGFWAFVTAFRNPEMFSTLGGHSPFFDLYHAPATHNPMDLALAPPPDPELRIWIDRGANDYAGLNIDLIHERLTDNEINHIYLLYPVGRHEDAYWSAHVEDYLRFYSANWLDDVRDYPPCDLPPAS